jgi:hypothetical protein
LTAEGAVARWGDTFRAGAQLYNQGSFFAAHEAWELLWVSERDAGPKLLLQGLIQVAAGFHKYFAQNRPDGAARLLRRGLVKLVTNDAPGFGLQVFCEQIQATVGRVEGAGAEGSTSPALRLCDVPRL